MKDRSEISRRRFLSGAGTLAGAALAVPLAPAALAIHTPPLPSQGPASSEMMQKYLDLHLKKAFEKHRTAYEARQTPEQIRSYQIQQQRSFREELGGFPDRTPLNVRVTGQAAYDGFRIEKVLFESQPGYYVSAVMFLPLTPGPYPGILFPLGHSANGKAAENYQRTCILMARNGLAVLSYDQIGHGERNNFLTADGTPVFSTPTREHQLMGLGSTLLGENIATSMIWDGMRAIDYMQSRRDIDSARIGCTGNSGGGTLTAYLMALDERIACAAPSCYITSYERLLETIGPQDAEQTIHAQLRDGMDHVDYLMMRAPLPTLVCTATRDFFDIQGSWDSFRQAKRLYTRLGFPERIAMVETDAQHGFSTNLRVATTRWMRRWLLGRHEAIVEDDFPVLPDEELQVTPDGQVMLLPGARSLFDLNLQTNQRLTGHREQRWRTNPRQALARVRSIAGIQPLTGLPRLRAETDYTHLRNGYRLERLRLHGEQGIWLPAFHFKPAAGSSEAFLYLHDQGKELNAEPGGLIEELVLDGYGVLAVDLRGIGETRRTVSRVSAFDELVGPSWSDATVAYLLGRSLVGMRAEDTLACAQFMHGAGYEAVHLVAFGEAGVPALHAAALEPHLFESVELIHALYSWTNLLQTPHSSGMGASVVHGALREYDLPDLAASIPSEKIHVVQPYSADGKLMSPG